MPHSCCDLPRDPSVRQICDKGRQHRRPLGRTVRSEISAAIGKREASGSVAADQGRHLPFPIWTHREARSGASDAAFHLLDDATFSRDSVGFFFRCDAKGGLARDAASISLRARARKLPARSPSSPRDNPLQLRAQYFAFLDSLPKLISTNCSICQRREIARAALDG